MSFMVLYEGRLRNFHQCLVPGIPPLMWDWTILAVLEDVLVRRGRGRLMVDDCVDERWMLW